MATENKPTTKDCAIIIMQYSNQPLIISENSKELYRGKLCYINISDGDVVIEGEGDFSADINQITIEVIPLEKISEEDLFEICLVGITPPISEREKAQILKNKDRIVKSFLDIDTDRLVPVRVAFNYQDILREKGYALPYKNWSVKELEEFGIYKLIE